MVVCIYAQEGHSSGRVGGAGVWGGGVESNISTMFWLCLRSRRGYWLFDLTTLQVWKYQIPIIGSTTMDEAWERLATCREQGCVALSCGGPNNAAIR